MVPQIIVIVILLFFYWGGGFTSQIIPSLSFLKNLCLLSGRTFCLALNSIRAGLHLTTSVSFCSCEFKKSEFACSRYAIFFVACIMAVSWICKRCPILPHNSSNMVILGCNAVRSDLEYVWICLLLTWLKQYFSHNFCVFQQVLY